MLKESITQDNILSLLVARNIMLPWRCQSDLQIVVPYEEYCKFVKKMVLNGVCYIDGNIGTYERAISEKDDNLLHRLYLRDISGSIYNEVCLAHSYGKNATVIMQEYKVDYQKLSAVDVLNRLSGLGVDVISSATSKLRSQYYECSINVDKLSSWNLTLYYYSVYLRALTTQSKQRITINMEEV